MNQSNPNAYSMVGVVVILIGFVCLVGVLLVSFVGNFFFEVSLEDLPELFAVLSGKPSQRIDAYKAYPWKLMLIPPEGKSFEIKRSINQEDCESGRRAEIKAAFASHAPLPPLRCEPTDVLWVRLLSVWVRSPHATEHSPAQGQQSMPPARTRRENVKFLKSRNAVCEIHEGEQKPLEELSDEEVKDCVNREIESFNREIGSLLDEELKLDRTAHPPD